MCPPPLVEIGVTDPPKSGGARAPPAPRLLHACVTAQIQIPTKKYLGYKYKSLGFCGNNGWLMENMKR